MESSESHVNRGEELNAEAVNESDGGLLKKQRQRNMIQEETRVDQGSMDSRGLMEFDIESDKRRFTIIIIFFIIAFGVNNAERIKIWFTDKVIYLYFHSLIF